MKIGIISSNPKGTGASLRGSYIANALKNNGIDVYYFKPHPKLKLYLDYLVFTPYNIIRTLNKKFDYFMVLKPFPTGGIAGLVNGYFNGSKVIADLDDLDHSYRTGIVSKLIEVSQKFIVNHADIVTIQDNIELKNYVIKNWGVKRNKIIDIEQGVDVKFFDPKKYSYKQSRQKLGIRDKEKIICFSGHLNYTAIEVLDLIYVFKKIAEHVKDIRFLIIGGGIRLNEIKELAKKLGIFDKIIFTGQINDPKLMPELLMAADICVCYYAEREPNKYRNSMKLREYLSLGKLVVCTNIYDLKKFKDYTIQTKPDLNSFYDGLIEAIYKKETSKDNLSRRRFILKKFSWDNIMKKFLQDLRVHEKR